MEVEFVEGKCCGDCAKCEIPGRPRSQQGIIACAVANILPMVYCTHDLSIETNTILSKVIKKKDKEIEELKAKIEEMQGSRSEGESKAPEEETPEEEYPEQSPAETEEEEKPEVKRLPKTKK